MLVADLDTLLDKLAPTALAEPGDNCGLLIGAEEATVRRILVALELTEPVLGEVTVGGYDTVITHHPLLFSPVRSLVDSHPRERVLRRLVAGNVNLFCCHTNLDAAPGGVAELAGEALGLQGMQPIQRTSAGWCKFVGFLPPDAVEQIAEAMFAAGAGIIGDYRECGFAAEGMGWFMPGPATHPHVGEPAVRQRVPEVRWETVVPRNRLPAVIAAYVAAHPYEEPAFDVYPVEDVVLQAGLGRVGTLLEPSTVSGLAARVAGVFAIDSCTWSGDSDRMVQRVGVLPGSGRSLIETAAGSCEALITGDLTYHDAERAQELDLSLITVPHGDVEWWALRRWADTIVREQLEGSGVTVSISRAWRSPWAGPAPSDPADEPSARQNTAPSGGTPDALAHGSRLRLRIDGGSRGNPGPSAIGVVLEDDSGRVLDTVSRAIGIATNNVAEYRALLTGLELAERGRAREVEVLSDSELLVRQMRGEYKVKNEGLKPLHAEATQRLRAFERAVFRHVPREDNKLADELVNRALDSTPG